GIASAMMLRNVQLEVQLLDRVFAGQPANTRVKLKNVHERMPSFSITVTPVHPAASTPRWQWLRSSFTFPPGRSDERAWLSLPDRQLKRIPGVSVTQIVQAQEIYFPFLRGKGESSIEAEVTFPRRGSYQAGVFGIQTRFPFAFLTKTRQVALRQKLVVYPQLQ